MSMSIPAISETAAHLEGRLVAREHLTAPDRQAMHRLLSEHFEGVAPAVFERDLAGKDWAVLLEDDAGQIRGFSTFVMYAADGPAGERVAIVFSGDTIVDRSAWGSPALPRSWIHSVYEVHRAQFPDTRLFWLLITSGYRTYRFLPVFWREFHPRFDAQTPPVTRQWLSQLARARFGERFNDSTGVVRLEHPQPLRGALRDIPAEKREDPHVAFFAQQNPGYVDGDELVCLAELSPENLTAAGRRMVFGPTRARG
jgi:hypothetical protein